ncbi:unnamed protein product, partial [Mesorhabditis spiculigera]
MSRLRNDLNDLKNMVEETVSIQEYTTKVLQPLYHVQQRMLFINDTQDEKDRKILDDQFTAICVAEFEDLVTHFENNVLTNCKNVNNEFAIRLRDTLAGIKAPTDEKGRKQKQAITDYMIGWESKKATRVLDELKPIAEKHTAMNWKTEETWERLHEVVQKAADDGGRPKSPIGCVTLTVLYTRDYGQDAMTAWLDSIRSTMVTILSTAAVCYPHTLADLKLIPTHLDELQKRLQNVVAGVSDLIKREMDQSAALDNVLLKSWIKERGERETPAEWAKRTKQHFDNIGPYDSNTTYIVARMGDNETDSSGGLYNKLQTVPLQHEHDGWKIVLWRNPKTKWGTQEETGFDTLTTNLTIGTEGKPNVSELARIFPNYFVEWHSLDNEFSGNVAILEPGNNILGSYDLTTHQRLHFRKDADNSSNILYSFVVLNVSG